jgi:hypothetical protein
MSLNNAKLKAFQKARKALLADYNAKAAELAGLRKELEQIGIIVVGGRTGRGAKVGAPVGMRKRRKMSRAARAAISRAQKERWAKFKKAGR